MINRDLDYLVHTAIEEARISGKRELHLNGLPFTGLTEFPSSVFELANLRILNISGSYGEVRTGIRSIPPEIAKLKDLETLVLEKNHMEYGKRCNTALRTSPLTHANWFGESAILPSCCSTATLNSRPSPSRRS